jgi:hypothetical protein
MSNVAYRLLVKPDRTAIFTHDGVRYLTDMCVLTSHPAITGELGGLADGPYVISKVKAPAGRLRGERVTEKGARSLLQQLEGIDDWQVTDSPQIAVVGDGDSNVADTLLLRTVSRPSYPFAIVRSLYRAWYELLHPAFRLYYSPSRKIIRLGDPTSVSRPSSRRGGMTRWTIASGRYETTSTSSFRRWRTRKWAR